MSHAWRALGGRRRTIARQVYARDRATPGYLCPKCARPIDWLLPYRDEHTLVVNRMSKSVDHMHETQDGGPLTDLDNLTSVHLACNSSKGAARRHERDREQRRTTAYIAIDPREL